jgi:hypothetical protein
MTSSWLIFVLLCILIFVYHFGLGIYYVLGTEPLPTFEFLYSAAFLCGIVWWLRAEARGSSMKQLYCPGLLIGWASIIVVPYHLFKTRGVKALIPLAFLLMSYVAAYLATAILFFILRK